MKAADVLPCDGEPLSAVELLAVGLAGPPTHLDDLDNILILAACTLAKTPAKDNWVDQTGGLPEYICRIARSIHRKRGMPVGRAIAIAVDRVREWASGRGGVDADTRAKAAAAAAQWEKKKAKARATPNK